MTPPGASHFLMSRYRAPCENLYVWGEGGAESVKGHGREKLQVTVEIMETREPYAIVFLNVQMPCFTVELGRENS